MNVRDANTFGIIGMKQLSCLLLQMSEQGIKSNKVSHLVSIIFGIHNWSRSISHHF